jgi:CHAT domain-containing protein
MWTLDGSLRYIPLAALWDGSHYLVEKESFTVYSPLEIDKLTTQNGTNAKVAAFGAAEGGTVGGLDFPPLPNVREEVDGIVNDPEKKAHGVIDGVPWLNGGFTEDTLLTVLADPHGTFRIAHLASHFNLQGDFEKSALLTGDGKLVSLKDILGGEGTLDAAQKLKPWSHLDLVVLSACNTAGPTDASNSGAETESFASVVLSMGASSVMASLWSVSDESTALLMKRFYKNWTSGMTKEEALRQAQIAMIRGEIQPSGAAGTRRMGAHMKTSDYKAAPFAFDKARPFAHPYYWAPFLIYGNWL